MISWGQFSSGQVSEEDHFRDVNESDPRSNLHYSGSSENKA